MTYLVEYTDTFGGEPNYCWVRRAVVRGVEGKRAVLKEARRLVGLTGAKGKIVADYGDEWHWTPNGCATVLMVRWSDSPHEVGADNE